MKWAKGETEGTVLIQGFNNLFSNDILRQPQYLALDENSQRLYVSGEYYYWNNIMYWDLSEDFDPTEKGIYFFENNNKNISINGSNQSYNIYPENIQLDNYGNLYFSLSNSHGILYKQVSPEIVV